MKTLRLCVVLFLFCSISCQYHQFFATKAKNLLNQFFSSTEFTLKNLPGGIEGLLRSVVIKELQFRPVDSGFYHALAHTSIGFKYGPYDTTDAELILKLEFNPGAYLHIRKLSVEVVKIEGWDLLQKPFEVAANKWLERFVNKQVPLEVGLPEYIELGQRDKGEQEAGNGDKVSTVVFDLDKYVEMRRRELGIDENQEDFQEGEIEVTQDL